MRIWHRKRWERVGGLYDFRVCPNCASLVCGDSGQMRHSLAHKATEKAVYGDLEVPEADGYIVGQDPLPVTSGAREGEE